MATQAEITHAEMTNATNATLEFSQSSSSLFQQLDAFLVDASARYQGLQADMFHKARLKLADTGRDIARLTDTMQTRMGAVNVQYGRTDDAASTSLGNSSLQTHEVTSILG